MKFDTILVKITSLHKCDYKISLLQLHDFYCLTGRRDNRVQCTTFPAILYCIPPAHYSIDRVFPTGQVLHSHECISLHHVQLC